ncbi:MAG: DUF2155 domain-containing protein, partial [Sphingomicrobium sp.]
MRPLAILVLAPLALVACSKGDEENPSKPVISNSAVPPSVSQPGVTPMGQRVATLGILNKRNGIVQTVSLHPGQSVRWKGVIVRLRACEATAPWEEEKLTGAFVRVFVQQTNGGWKRVFSGWLYKESPSLNVVEHPVYDVWPKSCAMTYPVGPGAPAAPVTSSNRSSAAKSGGASGARDNASTSSPAATPGTAPPPPPSAADSN